MGIHRSYNLKKFGLNFTLILSKEFSNVTYLNTLESLDRINDKAFSKVISVGNKKFQ